ncbi:MAG: crossover junction endodeoxyribonuclease RuvC [Peptostreptococcales bacterium]
MRILGIDPGFAIIGYGVIEVHGNHFQVLDYGSITTDPDMDMSLRLEKIYRDLYTIIEQYKPDEVSIEELYFNKNTKTAIKVAQARGVAIVACANNSIDVFEYTPLQIKQAVVGYGRAEKNQVQLMVKQILHLKEIPKPDDTADALAASICHAHSRTYKLRLKEV